MARQGRLHIPGGYYHVMGRGMERRRIFDTVTDKKDFLDRLGANMEQAHCQCLAWAIMSNHYHLLIRVSSEPLGKLMSPLLSGYATQYNYRRKRSGYVFQNRYKSVLCDADNYLLELIRYIHLNPLKAKIATMVSELDHYRWSGHAGIMGNHIQSWHDREEVLALFGKRSKSAQAHYRKFIGDGIELTNRDLSGGGLIRSYGGWEAVKYLRKEHEARIGDERILGDSHFVEVTLKNDNLTINPKTHWQNKGWDLEKLIDKVCTYFNLTPDMIVNKGRGNDLSKAKGLICYWGMHVLGISSTAIANYLEISQPAVSKAGKRGAEYTKEYRIKWEDLAN